MFFEDWAESINQNQAIENANFYDNYLQEVAKAVQAKFDKMHKLIQKEVAEYPFKSSEWRM